MPHTVGATATGAQLPVGRGGAGDVIADKCRCNYVYITDSYGALYCEQVEPMLHQLTKAASFSPPQHG